MFRLKTRVVLNRWLHAWHRAVLSAVSGVPHCLGSLGALQPGADDQGENQGEQEKTATDTGEEYDIGGNTVNIGLLLQRLFTHGCEAYFLPAEPDG